MFYGKTKGGKSADRNDASNKRMNLDLSYNFSVILINPLQMYIFL